MSTEKLPKVPTEDPKFSFEDFESGRVFQYLYDIKKPFEQAMEVERLARLAEKLKFRGFKRLFGLFQRMQEGHDGLSQESSGTSDFDEQGIELVTGDWRADETGVWKRGPLHTVITACSHPIMPIRRMYSIDTGAYKYTLHFKRGINGRNVWSSVDIDASDMASPTKIVDKLAPFGVSVTGGDRAKALVDYLRDVTDYNFETIPEVKSVSRMGWNEEGFAPYVQGVAFDGASAFAETYAAICPKGSFEEWLKEACEARAYSLAARIVLAASFAAPLIKILGVLPFFVHLWSTASGSGKTVGQMLAAAVWGNPEVGGAFFPTFRSTSVGMELLAGFLHSIPLFLDDLQLAKDSHGNVKFNVYELANGAGKLRANRSLGLNYIPKWNTCFITSGETPLVSDNDGEGALNRVLEIECAPDSKVISDGLKTSSVVKKNYGHAGKFFVEQLSQEEQQEDARALYSLFFRQCLDSDTTEKQAMAAATILTADALATEWIFKDGRALTVEDMKEFFKTRERVSLMERGYNIICDWVSINANKLRGYREDDKGECYGFIENDTVYIIRSVFDRVCAENGISAKGLLSSLRVRKLVLTDGKNPTKLKRFGSQVVRCVCLKLPKMDEFEPVELKQDELPF